MSRIIYMLLSVNLLLMLSCSEDKILETGADNDKIELFFDVNNYTRATSTVIENETEEEQVVENLYIFLFPTADNQAVIKYYVSASVFSAGTWSTADNKISLNANKSDIGYRDVYIVANCFSIKSKLDEVTSVSDLETVLQTTEEPWSENITTPLLMSGNKLHDFNTAARLDNISLIRAVAKLQLNITLSKEHQTFPTIDNEPQYKYKFINFDKNTYVLQTGNKVNSLISSSDWLGWSESGNVTSYLRNADGKVIGMSLVTYLNESVSSSGSIEISLPYQDAGSLPPPEFGDETYRLQLPQHIERNHLYRYDISLSSDN